MAVTFALTGKWNEAIDANLKILKENPDDTEALCRLTRAYFELGKTSDAKDSANKVLEIDPTNQIASKFIEKIKIAKGNNGGTATFPCNESFLEESGKTKMIGLMNIGDIETFANLDPGEEVKLVTYPHRVSVTTLNGKYIGRLPDDIAARLKNLIKEGYKYQVLLKSLSAKAIIVFVRETEKGENSETPSFPGEKIEYVSFTPPELVHSDTPDVETTEEIPEE